jgi:hypothetical protein
MLIIIIIHARRGRRDISNIPPRRLRFIKVTYLTMRNTAGVTGGKPIAVRSQSFSGVSAVNP